MAVSRTRTLLNVKETAERLGVHVNTVRNWHRQGRLLAVRLPGSGFRRFYSEQVERLRSEMFAALRSTASKSSEKFAVPRVADIEQVDQPRA